MTPPSKHSTKDEDKIVKELGTYIYYSFGTVDPDNVLKDIPNPPTPGPFTSVARITHDGKGNYKLWEKTAYKDKVVDDFQEGTYEVCTCNGGIEVTYTHLGFAGVFARYTKDLKEGRGVVILPGLTSTIVSVKE